MSDDRQRAVALAKVLEKVRALLGLQLGFRLWDGSRVPADLPDDALAIVLADSGAVARLIRWPSLDTLIGMHVAGRIDFVNGTCFDLLNQRPATKIRPVALLKALGMRDLGALVRHFALAPGGAASPLAGFKPKASGSENGNRANISYHYDLSNSFYRLFLDPEMVYSCAYFAEWHDDIGRAQRDKLDMICRKLRLKPGERFLDVGCGWGALACYAAEHYGVVAHGITLSREQITEAEARAKARGLAGRVTFQLLDYTRLEGQFDKIASIGMFEHVGLANHATYFKTIRRLLRPRGLYLHHCIARRSPRPGTSFSHRSPEYRALQRYVFPGGELDTLPMSLQNLESYGFEIHDVEAWREHYERTTRLWHDRLLARRAEAEAEVGREKTRMWLLYLAGCSLAFRRASVGIFQTIASRRTNGPAELPPSRADLYR